MSNFYRFFFHMAYIYCKIAKSTQDSIKKNSRVIYIYIYNIYICVCVCVCVCMCVCE